MNGVRRPVRLIVNVVSPSARRLLADAASNTDAALVNGPYRPRRSTVRDA